MAGYYALLQQKGPSLSDIFASARAVAQQRAKQKAEQGRVKDLQGARKAYADGSPEALQLVAPEEYIGLESLGRQRALDQQRMQTEEAQRQKIAEEQTVARRQRTANLKNFAFSALQNNPGAAPQIQAMIKQKIDSGEVEPFALPGQAPDDAQLQQLGLAAQQDQALYGKPTDITSLQQNLAAAGFRPGTPEYQKKLLDLMDNESKKGTTNITVGGQQPLTTATTTEIQGKAIAGQQMIGRLQNVRNLMGQVGDSMFTLQGKAAGVISKGKDLVGIASDDDKRTLTVRRQMAEELDQIFNQYRKEITGSGASVSELQSLKDSMLNKDLSPTEFHASLDRFTGIVQRDQRLYLKLLRSGINVKDPNAIAGALDKLIASGDDARSEQDIIARRKELAAGGASSPQIIEQLQSEGYLTPQQAQLLLQRLGGQ